MQVLKIVAEGVTTSFRKPHFMLGIQPTFIMPPPATIYGHICSVLGDTFDPDGVEFAYHFTYESTFSDIEHTHLVVPSVGKLPGSTYPKVLEGNINPFKREQLFRPRLVLYLNRPEWIEAFYHPYYAVVLGRSQDLFTYTSLEILDLQQASSAYFEHTLLPYHMSPQVGRGIVELLPRYLDYARRRTPTFARYVLLTHHIHTDDLWDFDSEEKQYWVDPTTRLMKNEAGTHEAHLGLMFHTFVGVEHEAFAFS